MTYQSHLVWAIAAGVIWYPHAAPQTLDQAAALVVWLALAAFGGLLPDVDHPHSRIGRLVPFVPTLLYRTTGHRGATHSLLATWLVGLAGYAAGTYGWGEPWGRFAAEALVAGYLAHLAGDFLTNRGIALLWPLDTRLGVSLTHTGSRTERGLTSVIILGGLVLGYLNLRPEMAEWVMVG